MVSSINSSQADKALAVKTSKPNFVANRKAILLKTLRKFGVPHSVELEVNKWIAVDILRLISQLECVKNTIHCFSIIY